MSSLAALALAPAAEAWLASTTTARVLNVFDRACNLVNSHGEVLAVVTSERGLTPFAIVVAAHDPWPFRVLTETSEIGTQPGGLRLGPYDIDVTMARIWDPVPDWPAIRRLFAESAWLDELAGMALGRGPAGSLLELFHPAAQTASLPAALSSRMRRGALSLVGGMQSGSVEFAIAGAGRLGGLGGGLTPAGDDFVLGVLLAAWAGLYGPATEPLAVQICEAAAQRTTTLSAAYLRSAARGGCSVYWHDFFDALLRQAATEISRAMTTLLAVGHTSGADALAGFLAQRLSTPDLTTGLHFNT